MELLSPGYSSQEMDGWWRLHSTVTGAVLGCYARSNWKAQHFAESVADAVWAALSPEQVQLALNGIKAIEDAELAPLRARLAKVMEGGHD